MKKTICFILVLCFVLLYGCGPSPKFLKEKSQGLYPTAGDFPNTKWVCREVDMYLYMLGYDENNIIGTYVFDGVSYRVVASVFYNSFNFEIYSSTEISASKVSDSMVNCNQISCGHIYTEYKYDNEKGTIVCNIKDFEFYNGEMNLQTLTFDKAGSVAEQPSTRWYAQEIDMYLDAYSDIDCYLRGEIVLDGEKCYVHALEIGNGSYYLLAIENGIIDNLKSGTTSKLIYMYFDIKDDQIIAKISDEDLDGEYVKSPMSVFYPYWPYNDKIITFNPYPSENESV